MAWIKSRYIVCLFLLTVFSQAGLGCKKRFAKHKFEAEIPPQVFKGENLLKVKFYKCSLGDHIKLSTNDDNFGIYSNGMIYSTRTQNISSTHHFKVLAKDLQTHEKWRVPIHLVSSANKPKVLTEDPPTIYFPKVSRSGRQKREWVIPPVDVTEHEPPMRNPIAVIISDRDMEGKLTYMIRGPGADKPPVNMFVIDPYTGALNITGQVDREINPSFSLIGQAFNSYGNPVEKPITLVVKVLDINDNAPVFTKSVFEGSVEELAQFGTFVLKLNGTDKDADENAQIAYRILSQGSKEMFVAKSNGEIKTMATNLDRETQDLYTLVVEARDMNGKAEGLYSTANVQIQILDVNDNIPTLEKDEYEVSVQENTLNDEVMRIKVFDADQKYTDNWLGHFDIIEGNEGGHFRFEIDEQTNEGILVLQKELDYEESSSRNLRLKVSNKAAYHSSVLSKGGGGGSSIRLKVNVKDQKEGFSFKPTKKRITLSENRKKVKIGQTLGKYPAISADTGKESKTVRYAKGSDQANFFNINPDTSEITLAKLPDRESEYVVNGKYTATVLAIDNNGPVPKTATGTVVIDVDDENDNIPIIRNLQPCMCDKAKSLTVTAEDLDSYPNAAPFTFKLTDTPGVAKRWKILRKDDTSMELQPLKELWPDVFTVPIKVEDQQGSGSIQNVKVHVVDCIGKDLTCSEKTPLLGGSKPRLGPAAIGLMALAALLLLLVPLLLLFCKSGGFGGVGVGGAATNFGQIPIESFGTVEHKNIEGGGERDTKVPLLPISAAAGVGGAAIGAISSEVDANRRTTWRGVDSSQDIISGGTMMMGSTMPGGVCIRRTSDRFSQKDLNLGMGMLDSGMFGTTSGSSLVGYMDSYINEKVCAHNLGEQTCPAHDTLLVYNYEGEGSLAGSIDSCNFIEDGFQFGDSYLNNLDMKFKTLADICVGNLESQESTATADTSIQQEIVKEERSISSNSGGLQGMTVIPDSTLMRKNYVVTTTINPIDTVPLAAEQVFDQQNVVVTNQVNTIPRRINIVEDPSIGHQNVVVTKMVNAGARGIPEMIIDPSIAHQNFVVAEQYSTSPRGNPGIIFNPSITHQNTVMTKVVDGGFGGMQGMTSSPSMAHGVEKNVMLTKSVHTGESQSMPGNPSFDYIPAIHKNVTLNRPVNFDMGGAQSSNFANETVTQKTRVSRKSVTSPENSVHRSVTKVTKVAQVMQE